MKKSSTKIVAVAAVLGLVGCGEKYPEKIQTEFMVSCTAEALQTATGISPNRAQSVVADDGYTGPASKAGRKIESALAHVKKSCKCMLEILESEMPIEEFTAANASMAKGLSHQGFNSILAKALDKCQ